MVTLVSYQEITVRSAVACVEAIRERVDLGWLVSQVRGPKEGPFTVLFRKDDVQ